MSSIVITGASSDIGAALVQKLAENKDRHLICHYHQNAGVLEKIAHHAKAKITLLQGDFSSCEGIREWMATAQKLEPQPATLYFLAAPPLELKRLRDSALADYELHFRVQVESAAEAMRIFLPEMLRQKRGKVIFLLSRVASGDAPGSMAPYITAKSALFGLFRAGVGEFGSRGLDFHALSPSLVRTKYLAGFPERLLELEAERSSTGRLLEVDDLVVPLCRFLEDSSIVPGQVHAL